MEWPISYWSFMKAHGARGHLRRDAALALRQRELFLQYPAVKAEPLDQLYRYLILIAQRRSGHFTQPIWDGGWRGAVILAVSLALDPDPAFLPRMRADWESYPYNRYIIQLAIDRMEGAPSADHAESYADAEQLGHVLLQVPLPYLPVRPGLSGEEQIIVKTERNLLREIYRMQGAAVANQFLEGTLLGFQRKDYRWWLRERLCLPYWTDKKVETDPSAQNASPATSTFPKPVLSSRFMQKEFHTRICIIGAGPGGAATALFLAKHGIECLLVDKASFPRDKICGDALSGKVVEVFKKLDPAIVDRIAHDPTALGSWGVTFVAPNRKGLRVPFKKEFDKARQQSPGFIAKRIDFDNLLVEECRKHRSIQLIEDMALTDFARVDGQWLCTTDDGRTVQADLVIAADGAHSRFAKQVGGIEMEPAHYCAGLRAYYKGVQGLDADNFIELHFIKDFLPGYFWIFPLPNGMANVGVGMRSDKVSAKKVNLKQQMLHLIAHDPVMKERFANAELVGGVKGFGLPLGSKQRNISGEGFMLVGDAASLIDPFTGEGIGNALYSGMFAALQAAICLETNDFSAQTMKAYDAAAYARLWEELKLGHRMQRLVNYPWLFNLVVNKAQKNKTLRETISCMFDDLDLRERLKNPLFYFKLLFSK